jgi:CheY-like chemotaxis protein
MGIKSLQDTRELVVSKGAHIGIANPRPSVRRALKLNGLSRDVPIYFNIAEAVSKLDLLDYNAESWQDNADMLLILQKDLPIAGDLRHAISQHSFNPGFRMKPVRNSEEAFDVLLSEIVDCILIDSTLRVYQVANFIEKLHDTDGIPAIPVLIVTKDDRIEEAESMVRHGALEILRLPFHAPEVVVRLGNAVSHFKDHRPYFPPKSIPHPRGWRE